MAPIVETLPSYTKDSQHALEIVRDFNFLAKTNFFSLWILHLFIVSFAILSLKNFFDPRTVKKPISETRLRSAKLALIIAFS